MLPALHSLSLLGKQVPILTVHCVRRLCLPFTINTGGDDPALTFLASLAAQGGHVAVLDLKPESCSRPYWRPLAFG